MKSQNVTILADFIMRAGTINAVGHRHPNFHSATGYTTNIKYIFYTTNIVCIYVLNPSVKHYFYADFIAVQYTLRLSH